MPVHNEPHLNLAPVSGDKMEDELQELTITPAADNEEKPYRAKELRQVGIAIKRMPQQMSEAPVRPTQDPGLHTGARFHEVVKALGGSCNNLFISP